MRPRILVTGAAGYIGGSIVTDFLSDSDIPVDISNLSAVVRSQEQADALSRSGVNVLRLDLTDEEALTASVLRHQINVVIHCASSVNPRPAIRLITALGKQKRASREETYFIHTSGLSAFYAKTGWPSGTFSDTGPVFDTEKSLVDSFPARKTDVSIIEHAKEQDVNSFIVVPSTVYGKGSGEWNRLSVVLPIYVKACMSQKRVYKFAENTKVSAVHIRDLTALYGQIVKHISSDETISSGTEGYYFALAHDLHWWEVLDHLASALKARGLVDASETQTWPSDEVAADALKVPVQFLQVLWNAGDDFTLQRPYSIGWKPEWDGERFLSKIDDEIQAVLDEGLAKSSLVNSLFAAAKK